MKDCNRDHDRNYHHDSAQLTPTQKTEDFVTEEMRIEIEYETD